MRTTLERLFLAAIACGLIAVACFSTVMAFRHGAEIHTAYVLSDSWVRTTGKITSSKAVKGCGKGGSGHYLDVVYTYTVDRREYQSSKVWFGNGYCSGKAGVDSKVAEFLVGANTSVYFNPRSPAESVLVRGGAENGTVFLFLISLCFPLGAVALVVWSVIQARKQPKPPSITAMLSRREQLDRGIRIEIQERKNGW